MYEVAALIHEMIFYLKMDRGTAQQIPPPSVGDDEGVRMWVINSFSVWNIDTDKHQITTIDLISLCHHILSKQEV